MDTCSSQRNLYQLHQCAVVAGILCRQKASTDRHTISGNLMLVGDGWYTFPKKVCAFIIQVISFWNPTLNNALILNLSSRINNDRQSSAAKTASSALSFSLRATHRSRGPKKSKWATDLIIHPQAVRLGLCKRLCRLSCKYLIKEET